MTIYLTNIEIAKKLNVGVDTVRRTINKVRNQLGIHPCKQKTLSGASALCLTIDDANKLMDYYKSKDILAEADENDWSASRYGYFYIIQLIPEFHPERVKIGFSDDVNKRLIEHQCSSPTAKLLAKFPCKRSWDHAAMDSITRESCVLVLNEVYEGNVEHFLKRAAEFFNIMPKPDNKIILSKHSPLHDKNYSS